jgi:DNA-binding transcriptional LysR family regulator
VAAFQEQAPAAEVHLTEGEPTDLLPRLLDGELDVALVYRYDHVPWEPPDALTAVDLLQEELLLLQRSDRPTPRGREFTLEDLRHLHDRPFVAPLPGAAGALCLERICAAAGFAPRIAFRSNDYAVIAGFVAQGLGVALVPSLAYRQQDGVSANPVAPKTTHRHLMALFRPRSYQPLRDTFLMELRRSTC